MTPNPSPRKVASSQLIQAETLWRVGDLLLRLLDLHDPPAANGRSADWLRVRRGFEAAEHGFEIEWTLFELVAAAKDDDPKVSRIPGLHDFRRVVLDLDRRLDPVRNARVIRRKKAEEAIERLEREAAFGAAVAADPNREPELREAWTRRRDENLEIVKHRREAIESGELPEYPPLPRTVAQGVARVLSPYEATSLHKRFVAAHEALGRSLEQVRAASAAAPIGVGRARKTRVERPTPTALAAVLSEVERLSEEELRRIPLEELVAGRCKPPVHPKTISRVIKDLGPISARRNGIERGVVEAWKRLDARANPTKSLPKGARSYEEGEDVDARDGSDDTDDGTERG